MLVRVTKKGLPTYWYAVGAVYPVRQCVEMAGDWTLVSGNGNIVKVDAEPLPDWDTYPGWARWRAVDEDGTLSVFAREPAIDPDWNHWSDETSGNWRNEGERAGTCPNWKDTLEERPEAGRMTITEDVSDWDCEVIVNGKKVKAENVEVDIADGLVSIKWDEKDESVLYNLTLPSGMEITAKPFPKGPYYHSWYPLGYGPSMLEEYYRHMTTWKIMENLFGAFVNPILLWNGSPSTKEENEMDCPRSKELTPIERVGEKLELIRKALEEHTERENERIATLVKVRTAIKGHSDKPFEDEIVAALIREADMV